MPVERIFISPAEQAAQHDCARITVQAGAGIVGDRHFGKRDYPGRNLTLVEAEEIEHFCTLHGLTPDLAATRRNLVTRGERLNELVGVQFRVGSVLMRGVELCEPCASLGQALSSTTRPPASVVKHWVGHGGLRVDVLSSGEIALGDRISREV